MGLRPKTNQADFFGYELLLCPTKSGALYRTFVPLEFFANDNVELKGVLDANETEELLRVLADPPAR